MSDNEDLLADDLGDQSLADYNLGNEEEDQLLADDYESTPSQNVPPSVVPYFEEQTSVAAPEYPPHGIEYSNQAPQEPYIPEPECVVPNIIVEVPNVPVIMPEQQAYAPYEPAYEAEHAVPPAIPAAPAEPPQIVPSELNLPISNGDPHRERFITERQPGVQRTPQIRDIPDSLDKVIVPGYGPRPPRASRHRVYRRPDHRPGAFMQNRPQFPPPNQQRPNMPQHLPHMRPEIPQMPPHIRPEMPLMRQEMGHIRPEMGPMGPRPDMGQMRHMSPELRPMRLMRPMRPEMPQIAPQMPQDVNMRPFRPMERFPYQRFNQPNFGPPNQFQFQRFTRPFGPNHGPNVGPNMGPIVRPNMGPNVGPNMGPNVGPNMGPRPPMNEPIREPEVRMLPVQLPPVLPPGGLAGKKVLINPHFKGNFQPPVEGLTYIPTRIQKSPPLSPRLEDKFGPVKDIDEAAERFIAEQRNALARAAAKKRRSPQRYIENTTIEIENDLARTSRSEDELTRRQQMFIDANRAGLRRRMRSPSPRRASPRRSPSPRRARPSPPRTKPPTDEDSEYRRRLREQENLRERVLRAKEVRRRKNATQLQKQIQDREREREEKERSQPTAQTTQPENQKPQPEPIKPEPVTKTEVKQKSPIRERSPIVENLTPPREALPKVEKTKIEERQAATPPLPVARAPSDDELDLILDDIDDILSDDDSGRFKATTTAQTDKKPEPPKPKVDLRSKLPARSKQRIVFNSREDIAREKTPPRKALLTSSSNVEKADNKAPKVKAVVESTAVKEQNKMRQRIVFGNKEKEPEEQEAKPKPFSRRVVLQRRVQNPTDAQKATPTMGIFNRAVRTAINEKIVVKKIDETEVEFDQQSDEEVDQNQDGFVAVVDNLPHGMTDTRMRTLAGGDVQILVLDKEERTAKITFKTTAGAETFKRKFNNKMVAASRLSVKIV